MNKQQSSDTHQEISLEEEMVGLFHGIEAALPNTTQPVIQFISSRSDEGVSTISREFASVAAKTFGRSVLVLDACLEKNGKKPSSTQQAFLSQRGVSGQNPELMAHRGQDKAPANTAITVQEKEKEAYIKGLLEKEFLPYNLQSQSLGGFHIGSLSELGASVSIIFTEAYFKKFLGIVKEKYDLIIIDAPPVSMSSIGLAASGKVDGVILVVEAENTRWPVAARAKERIEKVGGVLLGTVLNKQKHYIPSYIYNHLL